MNPLDHLLSHRLRGFAPNEGSLSALDAALNSKAKYLEIDTRLTADGTILVFHDAFLRPLTRCRGRVADLDVTQQGLPVFEDSDEHVATLEQFVERFATAGTDQWLLIDLKDAGAEAEHLEIIERFGIANQVQIVSWIPAALLRFHKLAPKIPLSFSFIPVPRLHYTLAWLIFPLFEFWRRTYSMTPSGKRGLWREIRVLLGEQAITSSSRRKELWKGVYPLHVLAGLPSGDLRGALVESGGSVGIPANLVTPKFVKVARREGLRVFVFSVDEAESVRTLLDTSQPDIIFTNNADLFCQPW